MGKKKQLELAEQQLIGFAHAKAGFSAASLAEAMGLSAQEWATLRERVTLAKSDERELDSYFERCAR